MLQYLGTAREFPLGLQAQRALGDREEEAKHGCHSVAASFGMVGAQDSTLGGLILKGNEQPQNELHVRSIPFALL